MKAGSEMESQVIAAGPSTGFNGIIRVLDGFNSLSKKISVLGMIFFVAMVILTFMDVLLRYVFDRPLDATVEILELMMVVVVFTGVGYAQATKAHVDVDIITSRLRPSYKLMLSGIVNLSSIILFIFLIWRSFIHAWTNPGWTNVLGIPIAPFAMLVAFGCLLVLIALLRSYLFDISVAHPVLRTQG